jgi:hypothetical protein
MATIDSTLADIMKLDFNTREMLLEILQKRQIEARREEIAKNAKKSLKDYRAGNYTSLSAEEAIRHLNSL